ncbi:hypothetical protein [Sinomicrobium sp. M5D2P17]
MDIGTTKKIYGIRQKVQRDKQKETILQYEMEVNYTKLDLGWRFELFRKNMFINGKGIATIMDRMAYDLGQVVYPLLIEKAGNKNTIKSREETIKRYTEVKNKITQSYKGETVESYLKSMEQTLNDPVLFAESVQKSLFLSLFIESCTVSRTLGENTQKKISLSLGEDKRRSVFNVEEETSKAYTPYGTVMVMQRGEIFGDTEDTKEVEDEYSGNVDIRYQLYKDSGFLHSIIGRGDMYSKHKGKRSFSLEAYHLAERD